MKRETDRQLGRQTQRDIDKHKRLQQRIERQTDREIYDAV